MTFIKRLRSWYSSFIDKHPVLYKWLSILIPSFLLLGILPYEKAALTLYFLPSLGTAISYVICGLGSLFTIFVLIFYEKSYRRLICFIGMASVMAWTTIHYFSVSIFNDSFDFSRIFSLGCFFVYYTFFIFYSKDLNDLIISIAISLAFLVALSVILYLFKVDGVIYYAGNNSYSFKGVAANRNSFVEISLFGVIAMFYLFGQDKTIRGSIIYLSGIVFFSIPILITKSATSIICLCVVFPILIFTELLLPTWNTYVIFLIVLPAFAFLVYFRDFDAFKWVFAAFQKSSTFTGRTELWDKALMAITYQPVFGYGFDMTVLNFVFDGKTLFDPHNSMLYILLSQGLFGLFLFFVPVIFCTWDALWKPKDRLNYYLMAFVFVWAIRGLVESGYSYPHFIFWISLIILFINSEHKGELRPEPLIDNEISFFKWQKRTR